MSEPQGSFTAHFGSVQALSFWAVTTLRHLTVRTLGHGLQQETTVRAPPWIDRNWHGVGSF
jgi:hypothetical protein